MSIVMHREVDSLFRQATEVWLRGRNVDASKKVFVATEIIVFDFELLIGVRFDFIPYYNRKCMCYSGLRI